MNLASMLRKLATIGQYGHSRKPDDFYIQPGGCAFYWDSHYVVKDQATWDRVARLSKRYLRFVSYCREIAPRWQEVARHNYADNSIEAEQFSTVLNRTRRVMVLAPGGDACF